MEADSQLATMVALVDTEQTRQTPARGLSHFSVTFLQPHTPTHNLLGLSVHQPCMATSPAWRTQATWCGKGRAVCFSICHTCSLHPALAEQSVMEGTGGQRNAHWSTHVHTRQVGQTWRGRNRKTLPPHTICHCCHSLYQPTHHIPLATPAFHPFLFRSSSSRNNTTHQQPNKMPPPQHIDEDEYEEEYEEYTQDEYEEEEAGEHTQQQIDSFSACSQGCDLGCIWGFQVSITAIRTHVSARQAAAADLAQNDTSSSRSLFVGSSGSSSNVVLCQGRQAEWLPASLPGTLATRVSVCLCAWKQQQQAQHGSAIHTSVVRSTMHPTHLCVCGCALRCAACVMYTLSLFLTQSLAQQQTQA